MVVRFRITPLACLLFAAPALAAEPMQLAIKDHRFTPETLTVPAGQRFKLEVSNLDDTPAEFESTDLKAEKIVVAGGKISVFVGPLKPGRYAFFDDYHPDQAKGTMIAADKAAGE